MKLIIATLKQDSLEAGLNELLNIDKQARVIQWLDKTVALVQLGEEYDVIKQKLCSNKIIFLQHVFPVHEQLSWDDDITLSKSINLVEDAFSVQCRVFGVASKKYDLYEPIYNFLEQKGFEKNIQNPKQIISVVATEHKIYVGISEPIYNISGWSGGNYRFAKLDEQISRAEFKLLEAIDYFKIEFPQNCSALDLGAAPGGWTRVLLDYASDITAVDPAELDQRLVHNPKISHYKEVAEAFIKRDISKKYDIIVNDMKMDCIESASITASCQHMLKQNGIVIMTLKLPKKSVQKNVNKAVKYLEKTFDVVGIRQLYHNRSEATILLKKKGDNT